MNRYIYKGPVFVYGNCAASRWQAETLADNKDKARSNIMYQAKQLLRLGPNARVTLPNDILLVREGKGV